MAAVSTKYRGRQLRNRFFLTLSLLATVIGLGWLFLILFGLVVEGAAGLNFAVFTEMTPPAGDEGGGLLNAIVGSLIMTALAVLVSVPVGIMAGTYLAEYGRDSRVGLVIRFVNDILLSAPSIVIGLFVYEIFVRTTSHFSGWAGAAALAIISIPVVVRTTEDMLRLIPDPLREAATALGAPRWHVISRVAYRAAQAGIITGVLLSIARISGETAPLLFTALNNNFWNLDLNQPMASLPVTIYAFASSPYENWQQLAWTGALLITVAVLALNIVARVFGARKGA